MKPSVILAAVALLALALSANDAVAGAKTFDQPAAKVRTDHTFIDVGDRATTYNFSSKEAFLGLSWIGGGKRPEELKAILALDGSKSRLDSEAELQALIQAVGAGSNVFAALESDDDTFSFKVVNTRGIADHFNIDGLVVTPIPGAALLLGSGLAGLLWARRRSSAVSS